MWTTLGGYLAPALGAASLLPIPRPKPQAIVLPKQARPYTPTTKKTADNLLDDLHARKAAWVATSPQERVVLLRQVLEDFINESRDMAATSTLHKGSYGQGVGEEWAALACVVVGLTDYIYALESDGAPAPVAIRERAGGQKVAEVFPRGPVGLLFPGVRGEVWIEPGKEASQGALYRAKAEGKPLHQGAVSLVLGAGNQLNVVCLDVLHKLVAEDEVVLVKMSPVNESCGPSLEKAFKALIDKGYLALAYGGKEIGEYLTHHPKVDSIHLTGSKDTFNAIVWGSPGAKREGKPPLSKRVTAELGNVTPYIVVPGATWSQWELEFHAKSIAGGLTQNASHNCIAAEVLITAKDWPQREAFLAALKKELNQMHHRVPWYPGACAKLDKFRKAFPKATVLGVPPAGNGTGALPEEARPQPWLLMEGLSPDEARVEEENWCGVLQEVAIPGTGDNVEAFLQAALPFVNKRCWGSLAASVFVHPQAMASAPGAVEAFVEKLRYGCVSVNAPATMGFFITGLPWGGAPGNTVQDVESGIGFVHNTLLFDHPCKGVLWVPWIVTPKPMYHPDFANLEGTVPCVMNFLKALATRRYLEAAWHVNMTTLAVLRG